jgi:hypothetical protein
MDVREFKATRNPSGEVIHPMCGSMEIWTPARRGVNNSSELIDVGDSRGELGHDKIN